LSDDVLKYVGHKLDKHKGCDILDINPGTGLWSQKLHEYLQPRSHVLLEQQHERFKPFLDPLLTAPGSKYSLIDKDPTVLQTYRDMVADGVFPHQTVLDAQDPRAQEPNNTLLVTGSLAWDPRLPGLGFDSMAKQLAYHLASAAWTNDLFHAFGLVRTLFWVQHDDYNSMIADSINGLSKTTRLMGMYQNTNVFVQPDRTTRKSGRASVGREPQYEIETTVRALRAGREHGMELPSHRRDSIHEFAEHIDKISNGTGISSFNEMQDYLREQQLAGKNTISLLPEGVIEYYKFMKHIINVFPEIDLGEREDLTGRRSRRSVPRGHPYKDDIQEFYRQSTVMTNTFKKRLQVSATADIGEAMYKLECKILDMQDGPAKDAAMTQLKDLETKWNHAVESLNANYSKAAAVEIDDRLAIRSTPLPRLEFDARSFEPLTMRSNEVWPQNRLSLISGEPNPRPVGGSPDFYEWVRDFIFGLFVQPSEGVSHALDKMQHGLGHIIKECPSLRDPKKGGRLQMEHLRVRMLTPEMIFELAEAYRNWPFKEPGSDNFQYFKYKHSAHPYVPRHGEH
jgi:transcription factor 1